MIRNLNIVGLTMVVAFVGCIGGWARPANSPGAVIATGTVIVESIVKKVQHPTGGVVKEILVQDGSAVEEGPGRGPARRYRDARHARRRALPARREQRAARTPAGRARRRRRRYRFRRSSPRARGEATVATAINGEEKLFESRKAARAGQRCPAARAHRRKATRRSADLPPSSRPRRARSSSSPRSWSASPISTRRTW